MFETEERGSKSDRTRARISAAAIDSFTTRGYTDTTMRSIAEQAGVSVGNAYYYFPSKEHLVQALYEQVQREHEHLARERLEGERFGDWVIRAGIIAATTHGAAFYDHVDTTRPLVPAA